MNDEQIDWEARRWGSESYIRPVRFVVLWSYELPGPEGVEDPFTVREWNNLGKAASRVLREWSDCVERVVHRHTIMPFVSVNLVSWRMVPVQDLDMSEEYWESA